MPKENIERAVKKGTGELEGVEYLEVTYEGYGPGGVALLIDALTDNPTRTVAEVRARVARSAATSARRTPWRGCSSRKARSTWTPRSSTRTR